MRISRLAAGLGALALLGSLSPVAAAVHLRDAAIPPSDATTPPNLEQIGHNPLRNRGMNAALAVHGKYAYVGSRTDGKPASLNLTSGGVMVVDVSDPAAPTVVNEMGPPNEGNAGESSRELRVWRSQDILMVLHTNCGAGNAHLCQTPLVWDIRFYDISGQNGADPKPLLTFKPPVNPHELFLWEDPFNSDRALLFSAPGGRSMQVYDISPILEGKQPTTLGNVSSGVPSGGLHSLTVSNDGTRAYFAHLTGGFVVADVSDFTTGVANPQLRLVTPAANRVSWPGPGAHSAAKLWGKDYVLTADEVYGTATGSSHGCPWGWSRLIDIAEPAAPEIRAEYKLQQNDPAWCSTDQPRPFSSYSAHNPTLTPNVAFITWHSGGLQAVSLTEPADPQQLAEFKPVPLPYVVTEDPRLSAGQDKVVMWSFPIIQNGLIYVADLRNGLYILRYNGPFHHEVRQIDFLEGNSNLGDALCFEPVLKPGANPAKEDSYYVPDYCDQ